MVWMLEKVETNEVALINSEEEFRAERSDDTSVVKPFNHSYLRVCGFVDKCEWRYWICDGMLWRSMCFFIAQSSTNPSSELLLLGLIPLVSVFEVKR